MPHINAGDTAWVLVSAALVLFMTPGLALFYGGMVRSKNVLAIMVQIAMCIGVVSILWVLVGFALSFGHDAGGGIIGDLRLSGLSHINAGIPGFKGLHIPPLAFVTFQMMFAVITAALITGGTADRLKFQGFALFVVIWLLMVYAPLAHWAFSPGGWLAHRGVLDFAGGTVVEINSGFSTLAVVAVIGRRSGWPKSPMLPHSIPLTFVGVGILWFGWFGFNAGSALSAGHVAAIALLNTQLAACAGLLGWILVERFTEGTYTTLGASSGAVAGMVSITPCAGFVGVMPAIVIGLAAGVACVLAVRVKFRWKYDDSLDVFGVHGIGGVVGMVLLGLFAAKSVNAAGANGLFSGGGFHLLGLQLLATLASAAWAFGISWLIAQAVHRTVGMRVAPAAEFEGLDTAEHAERAYSTET